MAVLVLALLIVILLGAFGFVLHLLWWLAIIALVLWLLGFLLRVGESSGPRRRWYRW